MLFLALVWSLLAQAPPSIILDEAEENAILSVVLADPWLRIPGSQYVVPARKTSLPPLTPWTREKPSSFPYSMDGTKDWKRATADLLASAKQRNKHAMAISMRALPPDARWCEDSKEPVRSCLIVSRPGIAADGTSAAVAVQTPSLAGWTTYLEKRNGKWEILGRGFLYLAG
jgi:hypothetical protein